MALGGLGGLGSLDGWTRIAFVRSKEDGTGNGYCPLSGAASPFPDGGVVV